VITPLSQAFLFFQRRLSGILPPNCIRSFFPGGLLAGPKVFWFVEKGPLRSVRKSSHFSVQIPKSVPCSPNCFPPLGSNCRLFPPLSARNLELYHPLLGHLPDRTNTGPFPRYRTMKAEKRFTSLRIPFPLYW